jgi:hypothetical protein
MYIKNSTPNKVTTSQNKSSLCSNYVVNLKIFD